MSVLIPREFEGKFGSAPWYLEANLDCCKVLNLSGEIIVIPDALDM
jgi:hypothetical protein